MKIKEVITEMTWRGQDYSEIAEKFGKSNAPLWRIHGDYIADIEQYKVFKFNNFYSLWDNDTLVAFTSLTDNVVDDVWVNESYRGQKLFSKLLWFYKSRLNKNPLYMGKIHSPMMQEVMKGMSRFKKQWHNIETQENEPFDLTTLDNYYSDNGSTSWRLMLENTGDFSDWPMYNTNVSYIKEDYTEIIK